MRLLTGVVALGTGAFTLTGALGSARGPSNPSWMP